MSATIIDFREYKAQRRSNQLIEAGRSLWAHAEVLEGAEDLFDSLMVFNHQRFKPPLEWEEVAVISDEIASRYAYGILRGAGPKAC